MIPAFNASNSIIYVISFIEGSACLKKIAVLTEKVVKLGFKIYPLIRGVSYGGYGLKLFFWDGLRVKIKLYSYHSNGSIKNIALALQWFYARIKLIQTKTSDYSLFAGVSYTNAGICGTILGLGQMGVKGLSKLRCVASSASQGFFLFSDLLSLNYYVNLFFSASKISRYCTGYEKQTAIQLKISAALGIASCFIYLFSAALLLFGGPVGVAFMLCGIAGTTSCLRVLYDFFFRSPEVYI